MRVRLWVVSVLLLAACVGPGSDGAGAAEAATFGSSRSASAALPAPASRVPDHIVLTWVDAPERTQSVTWRSNGKGEAAFGEVGVRTRRREE